MTVEVETLEGPYTGGEQQFTIREYYSDKKRKHSKVVVHPWHRPHGRRYDSQVAVTVGHYTRKGYVITTTGDYHEEYQVMIVNRAEFVEGILAVFPELKRA